MVAPAIQAFLDRAWGELGLARNTLAAYRADLSRFEQWLRARGRQEAGAIAARRLFRRGELDAATAALVASFEEHRTAPFASRAVLGRAVQLTYEVAGGDAARAKRLFDALAPPFSVLLLEEYRNQTRVSLARKVGTHEACVEALRPFETSPPWDDPTLSFRVTCYERAGHPLLRQAKDDLSDYRAMRPPTLE